ncbi:hypothetical protein ABK249_15255 [Neorhizobium sp. Rsf11]|uniref:Uncharacterized protein n=2 Tax=Neorhizobium TaxID=1525371 RepID=A0ABV0M347_9HYPH|nr:hypothetical protein [Neorhizobium petrolearium]MCC2609454.1 hypothetical protein [Neorhizobium petrolearium]WGI69662.1 hypothetical protein QEO92_06225 [Neorhizobium petrolearium]
MSLSIPPLLYIPLDMFLDAFSMLAIILPIVFSTVPVWASIRSGSAFRV